MNAEPSSQLAESVAYELLESVLPPRELPAPDADQGGRLEGFMESAHILMVTDWRGDY
jgi:hypothetical protein